MVRCRLFLIALIFPFSAWGGARVVVVRSSRFSLYDEIASGMTACFSGAVTADLVLSDDAAANEALLKNAQAAKPTAYLTLGTVASRFVREREKTVPSVFAGIVDPESNGLAAPGVSLDIDVSAQIRFLRKYFPDLKRIGVLYMPGRNINTIEGLKKLKAQGESIVLAEVPSIDKLAGALQSLSGQADCLLMVPDALIYSAQTTAPLILQSIQMGLPVIAISLPFVRAGAMVGIYPNLKKNGCQAAKLLESASMGSAPTLSMWAEDYSVSVNLVVSGRLKYVIPEAVIKSSEQVIR
jgi:putative ABC transport system substrate-binding protein